MNRLSARSAFARTVRAAGYQNSLSIPTTAFFSTTPSQAVLKNVPGRQDRLAAAASEFSSLNDNSNNKSSSSPFQKAPPSSGGNPHFSRGPAGLTSSDAATGSDAPTKGGIINVRSLPRSFRGASGRSFPGPSGVSTPSPRLGRTGSNPAFGPGPGLGGVGRFAGVGGGPRSPKRGGGSGRRGGRRRSRRLNTEEDEGSSTKEIDMTEYPTQEMRDYKETLDVGTPTAFEPALTLEGLMSYSPAVASSQTGGMGPVSLAMRSMRVMADGYGATGGQEADASEATAVHNPALLLERLHNGQTVFFDTQTERTMVDKALHSNKIVAHLKRRKLPEDTTMIAPISEAAKEAIVDAAIRGVYETKATAPSGSLLQTYHRYQSQSYTYTEQQQRNFDKKILELLPEAGGAKAAGKGSKPGKARAKA
ncbi:hypothetical protein SEUCBS139899_000006 [Sporothrix eucalyptigena]|uniref:Uncharacterized protein n=1 Tax=Sporothrix eucalyptigena TaxID=1812306 RepID=A0ABP0AQQ2_9PEZI